MAPSGTPPGGTFCAPCALIPAKRPVGTPYVAKIVVKFVVFKNIFDFCWKFSEILLFFAFLWNSYSYGGMGAPSRDAPGMPPDAPGALPGCSRTPAGRSRTPPGALIPAKRPVGTHYVAKIVVKFVVFKNIFDFCWKFSEILLFFVFLWNSCC